MEIIKCVFSISNRHRSYRPILKLFISGIQLIFIAVVVCIPQNHGSGMGRLDPFTRLGPHVTKMHYFILYRFTLITAQYVEGQWHDYLFYYLLGTRVFLSQNCVVIYAYPFTDEWIKRLLHYFKETDKSHRKNVICANGFCYKY